MKVINHVPNRREKRSNLCRAHIIGSGAALLIHCVVDSMGNHIENQANVSLRSQFAVDCDLPMVRGAAKEKKESASDTDAFTHQSNKVYFFNENTFSPYCTRDRVWCLPTSDEHFAPLRNCNRSMVKLKLSTFPVFKIGYPVFAID